MKLNREDLQREMAVAWQPGHTFDRPLLKVLEKDLATLPLPPYVYAGIKKEMDDAGNGTRMRIYKHKGEHPPMHIMDMPLREQLKYIWRYRALLRQQRRVSFWVAYSGASEQVVRSVAEENGWAFCREVIQEKERRRRYAPVRQKDSVSLFYPDRETVLYWDEILQEIDSWIEGDRLRPFCYLLGFGRGRGVWVIMARNKRHAECLILDHFGKSIDVLDRPGAGRMKLAIKEGRIIQPVKGERKHAAKKGGRVRVTGTARRDAPLRGADIDRANLGERLGLGSVAGGGHSGTGDRDTGKKKEEPETTDPSDLM